jgi:transglutaminase-like putative cysteine protease
MRPNFAAIVAVLIAPLLLWTTSPGNTNIPAKVRSFQFSYDVAVKDLPSSAHLVRVWIPLATSDQNQEVLLRRKSSPVPTRIARDREFGNRMLYAEIRDPKQPNASFSLLYEVARREYSKGDFAQLMRYNHEAVQTPVRLARFLEPDRLVPIDGKMKALAEENTKGKEGTIEKAHALYDYVFHTLRYDKSGTGWGRGDSLWACDAKHGNCTDFHSFFISMMRAERIPARFEIGFPLPKDKSQGEVSAYHCWAEFYVNGPGWVPVDISEAWKDPSKHDYFFGTLDTNRVQFTLGRDLTLVPKQDGPPLNYFIYPYVEVDGKPYEKVEKKFAFRESLASRTLAQGR